MAIKILHKSSPATVGVQGTMQRAFGLSMIAITGAWHSMVTPFDLQSGQGGYVGSNSSYGIAIQVCETYICICVSFLNVQTRVTYSYVSPSFIHIYLHTHICKVIYGCCGSESETDIMCVISFRLITYMNMAGHTSTL